MSIAITGIFLSQLVAGDALFAFNGSGSAPIGLYWLTKTAPRLGDLVVVKLPLPLEALLVEREYLPAPMPVLKKVSAIDGDQVCRFSRLIRINGLPAATALSDDSMGRPLPTWSGCVTVHEDELILLMSDPNSFDSRYFGPVSRRQIVKVAIPLWTWRSTASTAQPRLGMPEHGSQ